MKRTVQNILSNKSRTIPILSFPSAKLLGISVKELISSSEMQAKGMRAIAERCNIGASLNMMDLSVEAEAFGARIHFTENEIPTVEKGILDDISMVADIAVPKVGDGRTSIYLDGIRKAKQEIELPIFCGIIGPYSLAGRLFDMTELMLACYDSPAEVHTLLGKIAQFQREYLMAYREAGADGVIMAEPAAGLLSPALAAEFSMPYVKEIFGAVADDDFIQCYHNCGDAVVSMADELADIGADIYHFGNSIRLADIASKMPRDSIVMGNVDPMLFKRGTTEDIERAVETIYNDCKAYPNFMISSGCDIPYDSSWENIDAYFKKVAMLYA